MKVTDKQAVIREIASAQQNAILVSVVDPLVRGSLKQATAAAEKFMSASNGQYLIVALRRR